MFEVVGTDIDDGKKLIRVLDRRDDIEMLYYEDAVWGIPDRRLRKLLILHLIRNV